MHFVSSCAVFKAIVLSDHFIDELISLTYRKIKSWPAPGQKGSRAWSREVTNWSGRQFTTLPYFYGLHPPSPLYPRALSPCAQSGEKPPFDAHRISAAVFQQ